MQDIGNVETKFRNIARNQLLHYKTFTEEASVALQTPQNSRITLPGLFISRPQGSNSLHKNACNPQTPSVVFQIQPNGTRKANLIFSRILKYEDDAYNTRQKDYVVEVSTIFLPRSYQERLS